MRTFGIVALRWRISQFFDGFNWLLGYVNESNKNIIFNLELLTYLPYFLFNWDGIWQKQTSKCEHLGFSQIDEESGNFFIGFNWLLGIVDESNKNF